MSSDWSRGKRRQERGPMRPARPAAHNEGPRRGMAPLESCTSRAALPERRRMRVPRAKHHVDDGARRPLEVSTPRGRASSICTRAAQGARPWIDGASRSGDRTSPDEHKSGSAKTTEEMRFVALRESLHHPSSCETRSRAAAPLVPANIRHPEAAPMIIGRKFLVTINANIGQHRRVVVDQARRSTSCVVRSLGRRHRMDLSTGENIHEAERVDRPQLPRAHRHGSDYRRREGQGHGRGPDDRHFCKRSSSRPRRRGLLHDPRGGAAALTCRSRRAARCMSRAAGVIAKWCPRTQGNSFYTHFEAICAI